MRRAAFTLVELSIVLVIVGLLVGGILVGRDLVLGAGVQAIVAEERHYATATQAFHDKYMALPGDMPNATAYWGSLGGTGSDSACQVLPAVGTDLRTCNGDGSGTIDPWPSASNNCNPSTPSPGTNCESLRYWQHLANAGMIQGNYIGTMAANDGYAAITMYVNGLNVPVSHLPNNAIWAAVTRNDFNSGSDHRFAVVYGNALWVNSFALTPAQAYSIDRKADDGLPGSGLVIAYKGNSPTEVPCTDKAGQLPGADAGAKYNVQDENPDCYVTFVRAF